MTNVIKGTDFYMISVNNIKIGEKAIKDVYMKLNIPVKKAIFMSSYGDVELTVNDNIVILPDINHGGMLYVE